MQALEQGDLKRAYAVAGSNVAAHGHENPRGQVCIRKRAVIGTLHRDIDIVRKRGKLVIWRPGVDSPRYAKLAKEGVFTIDTLQPHFVAIKPRVERGVVRDKRSILNKLGKPAHDGH